MGSQPTVLAAFVQQHLDEIEVDPSLAARIHESVDPLTLKKIREAMRITRLPLALHAELNNATFELGGSDTARKICRATVLASFRQPYLEPLVTGALKIFRGDLGRVARWAPEAWSVLFGGAGKMSWVSSGELAGQLVVKNAPDELCNDSVYLAGLGAGYGALFDLTGCEGVLAIRAGNGEVVMDMTWVVAPDEPDSGVEYG